MLSDGFAARGALVGGMNVASFVVAPVAEPQVYRRPENDLSCLTVLYSDGTGDIAASLAICDGLAERMAMCVW